MTSLGGLSCSLITSEASSLILQAFFPSLASSIGTQQLVHLCQLLSDEAACSTPRELCSSLPLFLLKQGCQCSPGQLAVIQAVAQALQAQALVAAQ